jgi:hypothetical protein
MSILQSSISSSIPMQENATMVWTLDTTEGRAPLVERNALLSEDAKAFIAKMHHTDPTWCEILEAQSECFTG